MGGAPVEHLKAPAIVESTVKYTALTFRKAFNHQQQWRRPATIERVIHSTIPIIEGQTQANADAVKWYLSLNLKFCMSTGPSVKTSLAVTFCSEVFKSIGTHKSISCRI